MNDTYATEYTLSMTSSGAQSINVAPGNSGTGTSIGVDNITVSTTCRAGYNFTMSTSVSDNNLYLNGSSSNNSNNSYFSPVDGTSTLADSTNKWGYYYNGSAPTTAPTPSNVFSAIPALGSTAATIKTPTASATDIEDHFNIYYGVSINSGLAPGAYKMIQDANNSNNAGTVVYYLTMAGSCIKQYMQDMDETKLAELMPNNGDTATLYDKRDESDYQITKINNQYWMTQNLRITGTISSTDSNFNNVSSWQVDQGDLDSTITTSGYASYTAPRIHSGTDSNGDPTMWYNFCAVSANNSGGCVQATPYVAGTGDVTGDICPAGWRLPTKAEFDGLSSYASIFNIVKGGNYYNGAVNSTTTAYWWASTNAYAETSHGYRQYYLVANASNVLSTTQNNTRRGEYVRCIKHPEYTIVTVDFAGSGINSVTFSNATYGNQTVSSSGGTVTIKTGASYTITANLASGATLTSWLASDGTLGSTTANPTTYITSGAATITATAEKPVGKLYDLVAAQSKGKQTLAQLRTAITTSNSGVYEYNSSVFGTASDAANTSTIYYYRGILDTTVGSYGSDGDNAAYPNTVLLDSGSNGKDTSDTCWRIVRTTGSGGVKMIYQGKWTGSTCANAETSAQVATSAFNGATSTYQQIVRVGYTHNSTYAVNTSQSGTIAQIFGSNSNPAANNTRSTIKEYIEDTWYANNMTSYTSKLEPSAGYCNDRTMNTTESWTTPLAESSTIASTYGTSGLQSYYCGEYPRNWNTAQAPSLTCGNKYSQIDRSTVDLYRYVAGSTGVSNQLKYPAALLTADEAAFAGSGRSSSTTPYHANSFLRSGSEFWLLSPYARGSGGSAVGFILSSNGNLYYRNVSLTFGVRPAISLTSGTTATSGSGTATDPWIVNP